MYQDYSTKIAQGWDYFFDEAEALRDLNLYLDIIKDSPEQFGKTLDIGCGTGRFSIPLAQKGYSVLGVDSSAPMLEVLERKNKQTNLQVGIERTSFEDFNSKQSFDGIVAFYVLQFMLKSDDVISFFRKAHSLLSEKGTFLFSVYNPLGVWNPAGWTANHISEFNAGFARGEYTFTPTNTIKGIAKASDYRILRNNGDYSVEYYTRMIRLYTLMEYKFMLKEAGFKTVEAYSEQSPAPITDETTGAFKLYIASQK